MFKELNIARDVLLDPSHRDEHDSQLRPENDTGGYHDVNNLDTGFITGEYDSDDEDKEMKEAFYEKLYSTTPRNYRSQYSTDPCDDNYNEHKHYTEEYTPRGAQRDPEDDDPREERDRPHCHYEPYKPGPGPKRCQGCKQRICVNETECQRAKHIVDHSKFYVTKCCGYYLHSLCYRGALFENLDPEGRFRCVVCHNYAEGDVVYHAFDLEILPDVNFKTSPSPWRICPYPYDIKNNDPKCICFVAREGYKSESKCRCFTSSCFTCNRDDSVRWMFHLLWKRVISPEAYMDFVWHLKEYGEIDDVDATYLYDKIFDSNPMPLPAYFNSYPRAKTPKHAALDGVNEKITE